MTFSKKNMHTKHEPQHEEITKLQAQSEENLNGWKRALADYENLKKQTTREKQDFAKFATLNFIVELLPIYNHLKTSLNFIPDSLKDNNWVKGIENIKNQFARVLKDNGLEEIVPQVGEEFNPELHEAVENTDETQLNPDDDDNQTKKAIEMENKIVKVLSDGYKLHGRVIVPAMVVVK